MKLTAIVSMGPTPKQLKRKIEKTESPVIISYKGQTYEINFNGLRNLGLDSYEGVTKRAAEFGLDDLCFFNTNCIYCGYNKENIFTQISDSKEAVIIEDTSKLEKSCSYQPKTDVKLASCYIDRKNQIKFYMENDKCAFDEALVSYLADNGFLKEFESYKEYNFRPIEDFEEGRADPQEFLIKEKSLLQKIFPKLF